MNMKKPKDINRPIAWGEAAHIPLRAEKLFYTWIGIVLVIVAAVVTGIASKFDPEEAVTVLPGVFDFIVTDFLPPAPKAIPSIIEPLLDTMYMAVVSTVSGAFLSLFLALLCASPTAPHPLARTAIRAFCSLLRNIPSLAWALILVPAFGIGKLVGLIALFIGSIGTMTRFFTEAIEDKAGPDDPARTQPDHAEAIEEIDRGGMEAIRSTGGSYWQTLYCGVIPQVTPSLVSWTLYNLELNIRSSTVIGMVGGGGIGLYIQSTVKLFRYDYAAMAILMVAVLVVLLEYLSKKIREVLL